VRDTFRVFKVNHPQLTEVRYEKYTYVVKPYTPPPKGRILGPVGPEYV
jgi:hypothetical protein